MSRKVFTSQKLTLFLGGKEFRVQALVSIYGAKYLFDEEDIPPEAREALGIEVQGSYKGIPFRCRFNRETNQAGSIFGLRFVMPSGLLVRQISKDVSATGLPSPWMRGLARLATTAKHLPVPVLAVVNHGVNTFYLNVRNFTLGGLLLEYSGHEFSDLKVGSKIELDLVTNGGDKLPDIQAAVSHISAELNDLSGESARFQFGIKFTEMNAVTEIRYRGMIREHCQGLKVDFAPNADVG